VYKYGKWRVAQVLDVLDESQNGELIKVSFEGCKGRFECRCSRAAAQLIVVICLFFAWLVRCLENTLETIRKDSVRLAPLYSKSRDYIEKWRLDLVAGSLIDVLDSVKKWYTGVVLEVEGDQLKVHYDGWQDKYDEVMQQLRRSCIRLAVVMDGSADAAFVCVVVFADPVSYIGAHHALQITCDWRPRLGRYVGSFG
jgi:hypothetical protein